MTPEDRERRREILRLLSTRTPKPKQRELAVDLGCSVSAVRRHLRWLDQEGFIALPPHRHRNAIRVLVPLIDGTLVPRKEAP